MRLELTVRTDLALRALDHLATRSHRRPITGSDLAAAVGTTTHYLPQIMKPLVRSGWVKATAGRKGGYVSDTTLDHLSVLDVIEAVEGPTDNGQCVLRGAPCLAEEPCAMHTSWVRARDALMNELRTTSLEAAIQPALTEGD